MIHGARAVRDYEAVKRMARRYKELGAIDEALTCAMTASRIAYHYNFRHGDPELDKLVESVCIDELHGRVSVAPRKGTCLFFDSFALDNRGLTQQYLRALMSWGVEFTYMMESDTRTEYAKEILTELEGYPKVRIVKLTGAGTRADRINEIRQAVALASPEKAFLHIAPWSVEAIAAWSEVAGVIRYMVNITDHAFWFGNSAFDYCIEFRDFGCCLSWAERGIAKERLLKQPYYPIAQAHGEFQGFPVDVSGKTILLSGGAYYKVFGEHDFFFKMLRRILAENPNALMFFAGDGERSIFQEKIKRYGLTGRVIPLGNRTDIVEVLKHSDVYIGTYPISGGLMCQLACAVGIPAISPYSSTYPFANSESVFCGLAEEASINYEDVPGLHSEINRLIRDKAYRYAKGAAQKRLLITQESFNAQLLEVISTNKPAHFPEDMDLKLEHARRLYSRVENRYLRRHRELLLPIKELHGSVTWLFNATRNWHAYLADSRRRLRCIAKAVIARIR